MVLLECIGGRLSGALARTPPRNAAWLSVELQMAAFGARSAVHLELADLVAAAQEEPRASRDRMGCIINDDVGIARYPLYRLGRPRQELSNCERGFGEG